MITRDFRSVLSNRSNAQVLKLEPQSPSISPTDRNLQCSSLTTKDDKTLFIPKPINNFLGFDPKFSHPATHFSPFIPAFLPHPNLLPLLLLFLLSNLYKPAALPNPNLFHKVLDHSHLIFKAQLHPLLVNLIHIRLHLTPLSSFIHHP